MLHPTFREAVVRKPVRIRTFPRAEDWAFFNAGFFQVFRECFGRREVKANRATLIPFFDDADRRFFSIDMKNRLRSSGKLC